MRKLMLSLLLASAAATPALAQDGDRSEGRRDRGSQSASSDDGERARPSRARAERSERRQEVRAQRAERSERRLEVREQRVERNRIREDDGASAPTAAEAPRRLRVIRQSDGDARQGQTLRERRQRLAAEREATIRRTRTENNVEVQRDRDRTEARRHRDGDRRWSSHWRSDRRYDWRRHRDRHRSLFRFGRYYDPYGWGYRRFSIGFSLWPNYYRSSYWLNDPWQYRLPPTYGPYRWVRYYDDALLVNIYSGHVVDVIHNFFW